MSLPEFKKLVDEAKAQIREIDPGELKRMIDAGETFRLLMCVNRTSARKARSPAATIPRGILERDIDKVTADKGRPVVLY